MVTSEAVSVRESMMVNMDTSTSVSVRMNKHSSVRLRVKRPRDVVIIKTALSEFGLRKTTKKMTVLDVINPMFLPEQWRKWVIDEWPGTLCRIAYLRAGEAFSTIMSGSYSTHILRNMLHEKTLETSWRRTIMNMVCNDNVRDRSWYDQRKVESTCPFTMYINSRCEYETFDKRVSAAWLAGKLQVDVDPTVTNRVSSIARLLMNRPQIFFTRKLPGQATLRVLHRSFPEDESKESDTFTDRVMSEMLIYQE